MLNLFALIQFWHRCQNDLLWETSNIFGTNSKLCISLCIMIYIFSSEPNSTTCNFECNCPQSGCSVILLAYPGFTSTGWKVCDLSVVTPDTATATTGPETTTTQTTTTAITTTRTVTETTTVADDGLCFFEIRNQLTQIQRRHLPGQ